MILLTTCSLILDWGNSSSFPPVYSSRNSSDTSIPKWCFCCCSQPIPATWSLEFLVGLVSKLIDAKLVGFVPRSIKWFNQLHVVLEYLETFLLLSSILIYIFLRYLNISTRLTYTSEESNKYLSYMIIWAKAKWKYPLTSISKNKTPSIDLLETSPWIMVWPKHEQQSI